MIKVTFACAVSLALGAGIGWIAHGTSPSAAPMASALPFAAPRVSLQSSPATTGIMDVAQLRSIMREELEAARAGERGNSATAVAPAIKAPASPELVAQRQDALREIDSMINGSQWGNEQRLGFQQRLALLEPEQAERALRQVTIALNEGGIQVTTDGPPL